MSVGEATPTEHKVKVGDPITVAFKGGGTAKLKVAAITSDDTSVDKGAMYINITTAAEVRPGRQDADEHDHVRQGARTARRRRRTPPSRTSLDAYPQYRCSDQADYKQELKDQIGQLLNMVYGLLALAIIVAVLGVVNTLALSVVERTREIGLMRAIGLSRRQLRRMIRLESVVIALFGALLGLGLGMGWGATAQKLLALEGLGSWRSRGRRSSRSSSARPSSACSRPWSRRSGRAG